MGSEQLKPIDARRLLSGATEELLELLPTLEEDDWLKRTCYPEWRVKHIVAHLIQTAIGRLSSQRDGYPSKARPEPLPFNRLAGIIASSNGYWERAFANISPHLLCDLIALTERELAAYLLTQDLTAEAYYPVAWAGETRSDAWFDIAREYTERWHHQEQIREAVGAPSIAKPEYLSPVIATLLRAVPFWYSSLPANEGTSATLSVTGPSGGDWTLVFTSNEWELLPGAIGGSDETIELSDDTAWRFLTRSIPKAEAAKRIRFSSSSPFCEHFLNVKAIMIDD
jgi:uncharacterized protein (TIGR03083 family)